MKPTFAEYEEALRLVDKLLDDNPKPDSDEGRELLRLVDLCEEYEKDWTAGVHH